MPEHRGFIKSYNKLTDELIIPVGISPIFTVDDASYDEPFKVNALWDTGATMSCIKSALWKRLRLCQCSAANSIELSGIGGKIISAFTLLDLHLTNNLIIEYCPVCAADFPGDVEILIGMDIIKLGDFAISNTDNITSFSFAIPPFPDRINFAKKAEEVNQRRDSNAKG